MKPWIPVWILLLAGLPVSAFGQAAAEAAAANAASAVGSAAAAKAAGKSIGGALERLGKSLDQAGKAQASPVRRPASATQAGKSQAKVAQVQPVKPAKPAPVYEDPAGITVGMTQAELRRRFGEPAMSVTSGPGRQALSYALPDGSVEVEMRDDRVASVRVKRRKPPETAAAAPALTPPH